MRRIVMTYFATLIPLLVLDFIWLSLSSKPVYQAHLGNLMTTQPDLGAAAAFYVMYAVGLITFVVLPSIEKRKWQHALWAGALFGFIAYGTYDLTNQATLIGWSSFVSVADMAWGAIASACASIAGYFAVRRIYKN